MLKLHEIESIEKHIEKTANSGQTVSDTAFKVLKEFLVERLISCVSASDSKLRRAAVRVSGKFVGLPVEHQKRVVFAMTNRI